MYLLNLAILFLPWTYCSTLAIKNNSKYFSMHFALLTTRTQNYYRPQRSCGQGNIFKPVCHSFYSQGEGICLSACWDTTPWEQTHHPPEQTPPGADPPGADTPWEQTPPGPPGADTHPPKSRYPPGSRHPPPPPGADPTGKQTPDSMSGQYASYWNAYLF